MTHTLSPYVTAIHNNVMLYMFRHEGPLKRILASSRVYLNEFFLLLLFFQVVFHSECVSCVSGNSDCESSRASSFICLNRFEMLNHAAWPKRYVAGKRRKKRKRRSERKRTTAGGRRDGSLAGGIGGFQAPPRLPFPCFDAARLGCPRCFKGLKSNFFTL